MLVLVLLLVELSGFYVRFTFIVLWWLCCCSCWKDKEEGMLLYNVRLWLSSFPSWFSSCYNNSVETEKKKILVVIVVLPNKNIIAPLYEGNRVVSSYDGCQAHTSLLLCNFFFWLSFDSKSAGEPVVCTSEHAVAIATYTTVSHQ